MQDFYTSKCLEPNLTKEILLSLQNSDHNQDYKHYKNSLSSFDALKKKTDGVRRKYNIIQQGKKTHVLHLSAWGYCKRAAHSFWVQISCCVILGADWMQLVKERVGKESMNICISGKANSGYHFMISLGYSNFILHGDRKLNISIIFTNTPTSSSKWKSFSNLNLLS